MNEKLKNKRKVAAVLPRWRQTGVIWERGKIS